MRPFTGRQKFFNGFESKIFLIEKQTQGKRCPGMLDCSAKASACQHLKILGPKQMLQRLLIALAQVKASTTSGNLLSEIPEIICFLYWAKEITKKK